MNRTPVLRRLCHVVYEALGRRWPLARGHGWWLSVLSRMLRVGPYGVLKGTRIGEYELLLDPGDSNDRLYYFGVAGRAYSHLMSRLLRRGDCVIDVGANVGHFSLTCAQYVGPEGQVHAIEPHPLLRARLQTLAGNGRGGPVRSYPIAVWSHSGAIRFHVATVSGWSSVRENPTFETRRSIDVPTLTLDEFVTWQSVNRVRVLKLDVEGAEVDALLGAPTFLGDCRADYVLIEASPHRLEAFQRTGEELAKLMESHRYVPACVIDSERLKPLTDELRIPGRFNLDYLYVRERLHGEALVLCSMNP